MFAKIKSFLFENKTSRQTVAKNTIWLAISNFGGRFIKAAIILYAARVLGTAGYGVFSYAVTLAGFFSLFMDPGINSVLMRDIARSPDADRQKVFSATLVLKLILVTLGVLIVLFIGPYFSTLPGAAALLPIVAFIIVFDTLREFLMSLLRGLEKMQWEAGVYIFTNFAIVGFGFLFLWMHPTAKGLGWGYALGTIAGGLAAIYVVRNYLKDVFSHFSAKLMLPIIQSAWPFAIAGALGLLFTNTDILIISWIGTASDVGIYSAAIRIIQVLYLIPGIVQMTTLPLFARFAQDRDKFRHALERLLGTVFLLSIPLAVGGILLGTQIMSFFFGAAFAPGSLSFRILMVSMLVDFPGSIIANAIFVYSKQKSLIITSALGGFTNVLFDLILIPRFGIAGSAVATLIAQTLSNGYLWYVMSKINTFSVFPHLKKIVASSAVMALGILLMQVLGFNVLVDIAFGTILYFGTLLLLKDPLVAEFKLILQPAA